MRSCGLPNVAEAIVGLRCNSQVIRVGAQVGSLLVNKTCLVQAHVYHMYNDNVGTPQFDTPLIPIVEILVRIYAIK